MKNKKLVRSYFTLLLLAGTSWFCPLVKGQATNATFNPVLTSNGFNSNHDAISTFVPSEASLLFTGALTLSIRAAGPLVSPGQSASIPLSTIGLVTTARSMIVNVEGAIFTPLNALSTSNQAIFSDNTVLTLVSNYTFNLQYTMRGGSALLVPAGTYSTQLTLTLTGGGVLGLGAGTMSYTSILSITVNDVGQLTGSPLILGFTSATAYTNGLAQIQAAGLSNTFSNQPFQVAVKTSSSNFTNGAISIPVGNVSIAAGGGTSVPLSLVSQVIVPVSTPQASLRSYTINYKTTAGNAAFLNIPPGNYTTTLTFSLLDSRGMPFPANAPATSQIILTIRIVNIAAISLQNGSNTARLNFTSPAAYVKGVSLTQMNAMNVFSNNPYIVTLTAGSPNLSSAENTIPIGNIMLQASANPGVGAIICPALTLSTLGSIAINASAGGLGTSSQNFDLTYYTRPANTAFMNKPPGIYVANLVYTITEP